MKFKCNSQTIHKQDTLEKHPMKLCVDGKVILQVLEQGEAMNQMIRLILLYFSSSLPA